MRRQVYSDSESYAKGETVLENTVAERDAIMAEVERLNNPQLWFERAEETARREKFLELKNKLKKKAGGGFIARHLYDD